jgi:NitT/TauT family transport system substrate-binding protein
MKLNLSKKIIITMIIIIMVIVASFTYLNTINSNQQLESLTITSFPFAASGLLYVAQSQNYFRQNQLNVTLDISSQAAGPASLDNLIENKYDVLVAIEYLVAQKILENKNLNIIATIDKSANFYLIAHDESGIQDISDIRGKTIGLPKRTTSEFYFNRYLSLNGISLNDVTVVDVPFDQLSSVMVNRSVDAIIGARQIYYDLQPQMSNNILIPIQVGQPYFITLVCNNDYVVSHSQTLIKLLRALNQAESYIQNNPFDAMRIMQESTNQSLTTVQREWANHNFLLSLDQSLITAMRNEAQFMINNNLTSQTQIPDFTDYIYTDALEAVKPDAVNIIK